MILHVIGVIGTGGGIGKIIEYRGDVFENMSMEGRMTVCNMSIEGGAKAGLIAPDETTFEYVAGRPNSPVGAELEAAIEDWKTLATDDGAVFDEEVIIDAADIAAGQLGTNPAQVMPIDGDPRPRRLRRSEPRQHRSSSPRVHGFRGCTPIKDIKVDTVFIGSCTNSRIEDLRAAAAVAKGRKVADGMRTLVVPGSGLVKQQAEAEGLPEIFREAGRLAGAGVLDVPRHESRQAPAGRALRQHQQPQLRGRQGEGAAPTSSPPPSPPPPPSPGTSRRPTIWPEHNNTTTNAPCREHHNESRPHRPRHRRALDRTDVDTDQIIPSDWLKRAERTGFEKGLFSEWATTETSCSTRSSTPAPTSSSEA